MRNFQNILILMLLIIFAFPLAGSGQDKSDKELDFEVNRIYLPLAIEKDSFDSANTLTDLNKYYESSWVKKYILVEIFTSHDGKRRKAISKNDVLTQEQKDNMKMADVGEEIEVNVQYLPDNTLSYDEAKEINFTFTVDPVNEAQYPEGVVGLNQYLKEKAIDRIPEGTFVKYDMAAVKFTVSEEGEIGNVHMFESSKKEKVDQLLLKAIQNMGCWIPAEYANGKKVKQEFVLRVGNMENCMFYTLNIRRDL